MFTGWSQTADVCSFFSNFFGFSVFTLFPVKGGRIGLTGGTCALHESEDPPPFSWPMLGVIVHAKGKIGFHTAPSVIFCLTTILHENPAEVNSLVKKE